MRRYVLGVLGGGVAVAVVLYVVATRTYWDDVTVPLPPKGEALTNPFYAAQRFVEALGGTASRQHLFTPPSSDAVIVLSRWNWNLSTRRREALERWVESGGRLVVDETVSGGREFLEWAGIGFNDHDEERARLPADGHCARFQEEHPRQRARSEPTRWLCDFDASTFLYTTRDMEWALTSDQYDRQTVRVAVGRGSVTLINAEPFEYRALFDGDHAWLFVATAQLHRGDDVHFLSEGEHPSLVSLVWQFGAPVVWLGLATLALLLWRGAIRFGPLAPPDALVRRSLAEQIRGTGRFALTHDAGESLHAATARALEDAARRRLPGFGSLAPRERAAALADASGVSADAVAAALYYPGMRDVRGAIARLETVRRAILRRATRMHGTA